LQRCGEARVHRSARAQRPPSIFKTSSDRGARDPFRPGAGLPERPIRCHSRWRPPAGGRSWTSALPANASPRTAWSRSWSDFQTRRRGYGRRAPSAKRDAWPLGQAAMREELLLRKERCGWPGREEWHRQSRVSLRDQGLIDRLAVCRSRDLDRLAPRADDCVRSCVGGP
jgi:hypothetical protein